MLVAISSQAHLRQRNAIPRIRGTVDCLKPERNPTHATILTLDSTIPKAVSILVFNFPILTAVSMLPVNSLTQSPLNITSTNVVCLAYVCGRIYILLLGA